MNIFFFEFINRFLLIDNFEFKRVDASRKYGRACLREINRQIGFGGVSISIEKRLLSYVPNSADFLQIRIIGWVVEHTHVCVGIPETRRGYGVCRADENASDLRWVLRPTSFRIRKPYGRENRSVSSRVLLCWMFFLKNFLIDILYTLDYQLV